ncbi:UNVERIFIED_CONTAM: hypothetical protein Sradi_5982500 [Sesamum radiatum]|uniref:Uncharacterized protein n=1 Tax=Sesamum radiatum TaxID=300843 RepID=A0AAW2KGS7_SESRA
MTMAPCSSRTFLNTPNPLLSSPSNFRSLSFINLPFSLCTKGKPSTASRPLTVVTATPMASEQSSVKEVDSVPDSTIKLLFVEMGVGYDQHGIVLLSQLRYRLDYDYIVLIYLGSIPGVSFGEMKLQIKLGVPRPLQHLLDIEKVKSVFPYGTISNVEVVDGGLICSSGVHVEEMGDKNDDCYIVNAAVYVGY